MQKMKRTKLPADPKLRHAQGPAGAKDRRTVDAKTSRRNLRRFLLLALLGAIAFGATYGVVTWSSGGATPSGMVWIPGGEFTMGSEDPRSCPCGGPDAMPDARPLHQVYVDGFWMDATEVTDEQFEQFVKATGYVTVAEQTPRAADFPGAP